MAGEGAVPAEAKREQDWLAVLDAYRVEFLLLDAELDGGLLRDVKGHPGWTIELQDGKSVFLCRAPASTGAGGAA